MKTRAAGWLDFLQTLAIVAGLVYGVAELAQFRTEQHRQANLDLARSFLTPEFMRAANIVVNLPDSVSLEVLQTSYGEDLPDIHFLAQTFETIGIMVHNGDVRLQTVDDFFGTFIIISWDKLLPMRMGYRKLYNSPSIGEWHQWLTERLREYRAENELAPAYEAFQDWRPGS